MWEAVTDAEEAFAGRCGEAVTDAEEALACRCGKL